MADQPSSHEISPDDILKGLSHEGATPEKGKPRDIPYSERLKNIFKKDVELLESIQSNADDADFVAKEDCKNKLKSQAKIIKQIAEISNDIANLGAEDVISRDYTDRQQKQSDISGKIEELVKLYNGESHGESPIYIDSSLKKAPGKLSEALAFCVPGGDGLQNGSQKFNAILHDIHNNIISPHIELCNDTLKNQGIPDKKDLESRFNQFKYDNVKDYLLTNLAKKVQKSLGTKQTDPRNDKEFKRQLSDANNALLKLAYLKNNGHEEDIQFINIHDLNINPDTDQEARRKLDTAIGIVNNKFDSLLNNLEKEEFDRKSDKIKRCFDDFANDIGNENNSSAELYKFRVFYYLVMLASPVGPFNLIFGFADILGIPGFSELFGKLLEPLLDVNVETLGEAMVKGSAEISEVTKIFTEVGRLLIDNIPGVSDVAGAAKSVAEIGDNFMGDQLDVALESLGAYNMIFDSMLTSIVAIFAFGNEKKNKESRNKIDKDVVKSVESIMKKSEFNSNNHKEIKQEVEKIYQNLFDNVSEGSKEDKELELARLLNIDEEKLRNRDDLEGVIKYKLTEMIYEKLSKRVHIDRPCSEIQGASASKLEKGQLQLAPCA